MKRITILAFVVFWVTNVVFSQEKKSEKSVVLIAEPFVHLNGGLDWGIGYAFDKNKIEIKYRQTDKSDPIAQQKDNFVTKYKTVELSYKYFLKEHLKGFFVGGAVNYFFDYKVTEKISNQTATKNFSSFGLRFGYYWYPFKKINLFIDPTLAINFNLNDKDISAGGKIYDKQIFRLPPAGMLLRIGYKF